MLSNLEWILISVSGLSVTGLFIVFITSFNEMIESMKIFFYKIWYGRKYAKIRFIGVDSNESYIFIRVKESAYELDDALFILNPKKATTHKGIKIFTFVLNNTFAHDWFVKPIDILKKIHEEVREKKENKNKKAVNLSEYFHDPFSEPYRADAALLQEAMIKRMLSNATMLDKFMKMITSPNLIRWAVIIGVCAAAAAGLSFMTYDTLVNVPVCSGSITV